MRRPRFSLALVFAAVAALSGRVAADSTPPAAAAAADGKVPYTDVIPLTVGNIRGHKMLYEEGWFVVSSSEWALALARQDSIASSAEALREAKKAAAGRGPELARAAAADLSASGKTGRDALAAGTERTGAIAKGTVRLVGSEFAYSEKEFADAAKTFVLGYIEIVPRTAEDRRALAGLPGNYFADVKGDFSDVYEKAAAARQVFARKIDLDWNASFARASRDFKEEYERSGGESNSLAALGPILLGYLKALYHGVATPTAKTLVRAATDGTALVFLPVEGAVIVAGRTIESVGLTVFYTGRTGVHLISPTIEGGFLAGVALLSMGAAPAAAAGGLTLGAVNQVAITGAAPVAASAQAAGSELRDSGRYVSSVLFDAGAGATKVLINQASAGVVLGYNALTAVPAQTLLGLGDVAVFVAWDGPRLALATAEGRVRYDKNGKDYSVGALPTGAVVDLQKLRRTEGVKVQTLSTDPAVIQKVLEKIPDDARAADAPR